MKNALFMTGRQAAFEKPFRKEMISPSGCGDAYYRSRWGYRPKKPQMINDGNQVLEVPIFN